MIITVTESMVATAITEFEGKGIGAKCCPVWQALKSAGLSAQALWVGLDSATEDYVVHDADNRNLYEISQSLKDIAYWFDHKDEEYIPRPAFPVVGLVSEFV